MSVSIRSQGVVTSPPYQQPVSPSCAPSQSTSNEHQNNVVVSISAASPPQQQPVSAATGQLLSPASCQPPAL